MKIVRNESKRRVVASEEKMISRRVMAAVDDVEDDSLGILDAIEDVQDSIDTVQDSIDEVQEDDIDIAINNNIEGHFIAECESCSGVFISAVVQSDQVIDHVSGKCPICGNETDQYLKWVIKGV